MKSINMSDKDFEQIEPMVADRVDDYTTTTGTDREALDLVLEMVLNMAKPEDLQSYLVDFRDTDYEGWSPIERSALYALFNDMVRYIEARR